MMKRIIIFFALICMMTILPACASSNVSESDSEAGSGIDTSVQQNETLSPDTESTNSHSEVDSKESVAGETGIADVPEDSSTQEEGDEVQIRIMVGDTELTATMENNETAKTLIEQMPMTLSMMDLYGREMCYRYGADTLPVGETRSDGYEAGDLAYWLPMGSFVILYKQNGEEFERVQIGHIDSGVEVFENTRDTEVTFEIVK